MDTTTDTNTTDVVGTNEIADRLGVQPGTVWQWRQRGLLPKPEWTVSTVPAWNWATVRAWAIETGRLPATEATHTGRHYDYVEQCWAEGHDHVHRGQYGTVVHCGIDQVTCSGAGARYDLEQACKILVTEGSAEQGIRASFDDMDSGDIGSDGMMGEDGLDVVRAMLRGVRRSWVYECVHEPVN